jgi:hypothetical protein
MKLIYQQIICFKVNLNYALIKEKYIKNIFF